MQRSATALGVPTYALNLVNSVPHDPRMLPLVRRVIYGDDVSDEELEIAFSQVVSMVPHRLLPSVSVTIQDINAMSLRELKQRFGTRDARLPGQQRPRQ